MSLYKVCKAAIDVASQEWRNYCQWRERDFSSFASLDSSIRNCIINIEDEEFWNYAVSNNDDLTDVVNDLGYAQDWAQRCDADEILIFDFLENEDTSKEVIGYEILDGAFSYSLLTNFGNNFTVVNDSLGPNGLIQDKKKVLEVHRWFLENMPDDPHVMGSRVFAVYEKFAIH